MPPQKRNTENRKLPQYWRYRKGFYWFRTSPENRHLWDNKVEFKLGRTESEAFDSYASRLYTYTLSEERTAWQLLILKIYRGKFKHFVFYRNRSDSSMPYLNTFCLSCLY